MSKGEHAAAAEVFRGFKGDVENLLAAFGSGYASYQRKASDYFHPERSALALMDAVPVAQFGQIHPEIAAARKLRQDVYVAEFFMKELCELGLRRVKFRRLRRYPAVERDFSFIFPDDVPFIEMKKAIWNLDIGEVKELNPIEIFRGGSIPAGKYSILLRVKFQSSERTLREDELAQWSAKIVAALTELGGLQRA